MIIIGQHDWQDEVAPWSRAWEYEEWKQAVCGDKIHDEERLRAYYAAQWEPADCHAYLVSNKALQPRLKAPKERVVILDAVKVERRFALALWRECSKLATRRTTPDARRIVNETQERMEKVLGLERRG